MRQLVCAFGGSSRERSRAARRVAERGCQLGHSWNAPIFRYAAPGFSGRSQRHVMRKAVVEPLAPVRDGISLAERGLHPDPVVAQLDRAGGRVVGRRCSRLRDRSGRGASDRSGSRPRRFPGRAGNPCAGTGCRARKRGRCHGRRGSGDGRRAERVRPFVLSSSRLPASVKPVFGTSMSVSLAVRSLEPPDCAAIDDATITDLIRGRRTPARPRSHHVLTFRRLCGQAALAVGTLLCRVLTPATTCPLENPSQAPGLFVRGRHRNLSRERNP